MDFDFPPDDDPRRLAVRSWIENNPNPSAQDLVDAGYVVPHWPRPYGLEAEPMLQIIISDELRKAKIGLPPNPIGDRLGRPHHFRSRYRRTEKKVSTRAAHS